MRISDWSSDVCSSDLERKMPPGTRIAALFRGKNLLHPSGSTRLQVDDILCVIGHDEDLPALGKLFSQAPKRGQDLRFFGDFILEADAQLSAITALYGLKIGDVDGNQTIGNFMAEQVNGNPVVGDQIVIGRAHVGTPVTNAQLVCRLM